MGKGKERKGWAFNDLRVRDLEIGKEKKNKIMDSCLQDEDQPMTACAHLNRKKKERKKIEEIND